MTKLKDHQLVTRGVKSPVMDGPDWARDGIGHMALFDWDDHISAEDVPGLLDRADIEGPTIVWESSEGNLHGWNLAVRPFSKTAVVLKDGKDDGKHRTVGESRGWWRLRAGPKISPQGHREYKPAPEPLAFYDRPTDWPVAAAHWQLAHLLTDGFIPEPDPTYELRGSSVLTAMYVTFTDLGKLVQKRVVG